MRRKSGVPTINDVADLAGVSKRTVTRVLNRSSKVSEATRAKIEKIIEELNYAPSRQARGLAVSRSFLIGLVYDVPTLFINDIQKGILGIIEDEGYELVVHACDYPDERLVNNVVRFVNRAHLDGVIILPPVADIDGIGKELEKAGCPYVRVTSEDSDESRKLVVTDYLSAISDMTRHLMVSKYPLRWWLRVRTTLIPASVRRTNSCRASTAQLPFLQPTMRWHSGF
jgi:LacI family transcriptional regulator